MLVEPNTPLAEIFSLVGLILILIGTACQCLWLPLVAFFEDWMWGFAVFFIPGAGLLFTILNWDNAKMPFLLGCWCLLLGVSTLLLIDGMWDRMIGVYL